MKKVLTLVSIMAAVMLFGCTPAEQDLGGQEQPEENKEELVENNNEENTPEETPENPSEQGDENGEDPNPGENGEDPGEDPGENGEDPNTGEDPNNGENGEDPNNGEDPAQQNQYPEAEGKMPVLTPSVNGQIGSVSLTDQQKAYNRAANKFAFRILNQLYKGESMVVSPLSLQMALSMAVNGAEGETAREMLDVLGFGSVGTDALNAYSRSLLEQLPAVDTGVKLQLADALIADDRLTVLEPFANSLATNYYAPVESISFADPDYVKAVVNDWVKRNTQGLIPEILDKDKDLSQTLAFILNALYFNAPWFQPFEMPYQLRENEDFNTGSGIVKVDYLTGGTDIAYVETDTYQMAARALGKAEKYEFVIFLPKEVNGLKDVLSEITTLDYHALRKSAWFPPILYAKIPRFDTKSSYSLVSTLQSLGMNRAFQVNAEFGGMFAETAEVMIGDIVQKARLKLDENGVEGAAATEIEYWETSPGPGELPEPIYFYADHPFVYLIVEKTSETILFAGVFDGK